MWIMTGRRKRQSFLRWGSACEMGMSWFNNSDYRNLWLQRGAIGVPANYLGIRLIWEES
jgi:hypothetical protein